MPKRVFFELVQSGANIQSSGYIDANLIKVKNSDDSLTIDFDGFGYIRKASIKLPKDLAHMIAERLLQEREAMSSFTV